GLAYEKLAHELDELMIAINDFLDILANHQRVLDIIVMELEEVKDRFGDQRRSEIIQGSFDLEDEDLIPVEKVLITLTSNGYIKRVPENTFKQQNRGGKGIIGMNTNEDDDVEQMIGMSTHDYLLAFSNKGKVYRLKGYQVPEFSRQSKGIPVVNLLALDENETILSLISIDEFKSDSYLMFATKLGSVKRVNLSEFESIRQNGKIAISLRENDELAYVKRTDGAAEIFLGSNNGKLVRFNESDVRVMGRTASGVHGINLEADAYVVGMATSLEGDKLFVISELGYGKLSNIEEYRKSKRGAKGVKTVNITEKNGNLLALKAVNGDEDALIATTSGVIIRLTLDQVNTVGRNSIGVRLIKVEEGFKVASVTITQPECIEEEVEEVVCE
ncbi:MAG: DNA gyrase C-terminal beta-propeller domain-containing protein, partial [Bacilli bacterium]